MKLAKFLKENNYTQKSFIEEFENKKNIKLPQGTLAKWILEIRIPRKKQMVLLHEFTQGKVGPNDFYFN